MQPLSCSFVTDDSIAVFSNVDVNVSPDRLDDIDKLSLDKNQYDNFAYHTALLVDFVRNNASTGVEVGLSSSAHFLSRNGFGGSIRQMTGSNASSVNSNSSSRRGSIGNKNVFKSMSKKMTTTTTSSMKRSVSVGAF